MLIFKIIILEYSCSFFVVIQSQNIVKYTLVLYFYPAP
nr:MAG TPA_asm: hypothetical protein [Caudoviricetes sp.]